MEPCFCSEIIILTVLCVRKTAYYKRIRCLQIEDYGRQKKKKKKKEKKKAIDTQLRPAFVLVFVKLFNFK